MTIVRFDVSLPEGTDDEVSEQAAKLIAGELAALPGGSEVEAVATGPDRSLAAVGAAIAVALPVALKGIELINGLLEAIEAVRELRKGEPEATDETRKLLQAIKPEDILVHVGRGYVRLSELTVADLEQG